MPHDPAIKELTRGKGRQEGLNTIAEAGRKQD